MNLLKSSTSITSYTLFLFSFLLSCNSVKSNLNEFSFPKDWMGSWKGILYIYDTQGLRQKIPMELQIDSISASNNLKWTIIYEPERKTGGRQYILETTSSKNSFVLNENNGILLKDYLFGNTMVSRFTVMGNLLECTTTLLSKKEMLYTISSAKAIPSDTTGNLIIKNDTIPPVYNYRIGFYQKGVLRKE